MALFRRRRPSRRRHLKRSPRCRSHIRPSFLRRRRFPPPPLHLFAKSQQKFKVLINTCIHLSIWLEKHTIAHCSAEELEQFDGEQLAVERVVAPLEHSLVVVRVDDAFACWLLLLLFGLFDVHHLTQRVVDERAVLGGELQQVAAFFQLLVGDEQSGDRDLHFCLHIYLVYQAKKVSSRRGGQTGQVEAWQVERLALDGSGEIGGDVGVDALADEELDELVDELGVGRIARHDVEESALANREVRRTFQF